MAEENQGSREGTQVGERDHSETPRLSRGDIMAIATSVAEILRQEGHTSPVTVAGTQSTANEQAVQMGEEPPPSLIPSLRVLSSAAGSSVPVSHHSGNLSADTTLPMPSSDDKQDLVYITDGLPPVPRKLFEKIQSWQYVNLIDLSPRSIKNREEENHFLQQCDGKVLLVHTLDNVKRKSAEFSDIVSWTEAFATVVAVVGRNEVSGVPELMAYMAKVIRAARVRGSQWQEYDRAFRRKAAAKNDKKWSQHDADLWDRYIVGPSQSQSEPSSTPSTQQSNIPVNQRYTPYIKNQRPLTNNQWKKLVCFSHNYDSVCVRVANGIPCQFTHICCGCGQGDHKKPDCPNKPSRERGYRP